LHFKKITAHAIKRNLLSHVGRTPEDTMEQRLTQETQKSDNDALIRIVRPGVFTLQDGADVEEARQTVQLRGPNATEIDFDENHDQAARDIVEKQNQAPKQAQKKEEPEASKTPERAAPPELPEDAELDEADIGDIAEQVADILDDSGALTLVEISQALSNTAWSSIDEFGPVVLRSILLHANEKRGQSGQLPLFTELGDDRWTLAEAYDEGLAKSFSTLDKWQQEHQHLLLHRLTNQLARMSEGKLGFTVGLVMERLGYTSIQEGKTVGTETINLTGTIQKGMFNERVVVRVLKRGTRGDERSIVSFRGSLNLYKADRGILISLDGFEEGSEKHERVENLAPISLLERDDLAKLMLDTGVGVRHYTVSTTCLDDAYFAQ
jgi:hypothetical protein